MDITMSRHWQLSTVTMNKAKLIEILTENRKQFIEDLAEARDDYRKAAAKVLLAAADLLEKRSREMKETADEDLPSLNFAFEGRSLEPPKDYTKAYDMALAMLSHEVKESVELEQDQYQCLVCNDWDWMDKFKRMSVTYKSFTA